MEKPSEYSLMELSEKSGIPARTIRYYISKNLLDGPSQVGRNAVYTEKHLVRLDAIQGLKQEGLTLHEISVGSQESEVKLGDPISWVVVPLCGIPNTSVPIRVIRGQKLPARC